MPLNRQSITEWYDKNRAILDLIHKFVIYATFILLICNLFYSSKSTPSDKPSSLERFFSWFSSKIEIPIYLILLLLIVYLFYFLRIKSKFSSRTLRTNAFFGKWKNEWSGKHAGFEHFTINEKGEYITDKGKTFKIEQVEFNLTKGEINFIKKTQIKTDVIMLKNNLVIKTNKLLVGTETDITSQNTYAIKYTKI